jgi:hypothetical protein
VTITHRDDRSGFWSDPMVRIVLLLVFVAVIVVGVRLLF